MTKKKASGVADNANAVVSPSLKVIFNGEEHGAIVKATKGYTISKIGNDFGLQVNYNHLDAVKMYVKHEAPKNHREVLMRCAEMYLTMTDFSKEQNVDYLTNVFMMAKKGVKTIKRNLTRCIEIIEEAVKHTEGELQEFWILMGKIAILQEKVINLVTKMAKSEIAADVKRIDLTQYSPDSLTVCVKGYGQVCWLTLDSKDEVMEMAA